MIVRLPVELLTADPVNVQVVDYDGKKARVRLWGKGTVTLAGRAVTLDGEEEEWVILRPGTSFGE